MNLSKALLEAIEEHDTYEVAELMNQIHEAIVKYTIGKTLSAKIIVSLSKTITHVWDNNDFDTNDKLFNEGIKCNQCGDMFSKEDLHEVFDQKLCDDCYEEHTFMCESCQDVFFKEDETVLGSSDCCSYCPDCVESFTECNNCGCVISRDDSCTDDDGNMYCEDCFCENFTTCNQCGAVCTNDDIYYHELSDQYLCEECYNNETNIEEARSQVKRPTEAIEPPSEVATYLNGFYNNNIASNLLLGKPDDSKIEFEIKTDGENLFLKDKIQTIMYEYMREFTNGFRKIKSAQFIGTELEKTYREVSGMTYWNVNNENQIVYDYKISEDSDFKTQKMKLNKFITRTILLSKKLNEKNEMNIPILENKAKEAAEKFQKILSEKVANLKVIVSNSFDHKIACGEANSDLGSCQVSSNSTDHAIGFYDMFANPDLLPALIYDGDSVVGRAMVRRMYRKDDDKVYYMLDRMYTRGSISNKRKWTYKKLAEGLKANVNGVVVASRISKHDSSVASYLDIEGNDRLSGNNLESSLRPKNDCRDYYQDSGTIAYLDGECIFDEISSSNVIPF